MAAFGLCCRADDRDCAVHSGRRSDRAGLDTADRVGDGHPWDLSGAGSGCAGVEQHSPQPVRPQRSDATFGGCGDDPRRRRLVADAGVFHRCGRLCAADASVPDCGVQMAAAQHQGQILYHGTGRRSAAGSATQASA